VLQIAAQTRAICFGSLAQRNSVTRATLYAFLEAMPADALRIFDINLRQNWYSKEVIVTSLQKANVLKVSEEELPVLNQMLDYTASNYETNCRQIMQDYQLDMLIYTCGGQGSHVFTQDEVSHMSPKQVEVKDTVGAGDSFTASFIASILLGKSLKDAHRIATNVSAYVCTQDGATPVIPEEYKSLS
jgi:fructokinase